MTGFNAHNDVFRALTRVQNILLRYGDRIPPVYVAVEHTGDIRLQFVASEAPEDWRRVAVDLLASHYCSDDPVHHPISRHYRAEGDQIVIYTGLTLRPMFQVIHPMVPPSRVFRVLSHDYDELARRLQARGDRPPIFL